MMVFKNYAKFYDALYQDKDYQAECDFLEKIFNTQSNDVKTVLDLGCGTGNHVIPLTKRGYKVTGIDRSEDMLQTAKVKANKECSPSNMPVFYRGDIRDFHLDQSFDAIVSMFAVISYLTSNDDVQAAFQQAHRHLPKGGLFIFDVWHGPAVLSERPTDRYKMIEMAGERIMRFAHPEIDVLHHTVNVEYRVLRVSGDHILDEVTETHVMRFFFPEEIHFHLKCAGFQSIGLFPWLRIGELPNEHDWNLSVVAEA